MELLDGMPSLSNHQEWQTWHDALSREQKVELEKISSVLPRVGPVKGPQMKAFNSEANILGYGGAAGGGKSALLAILVLLNHQRSVVFRGDKSQLKGFVDDVAQFYGSQVGLNRQSGTFHFADRPGHVLEWGGLAKPGSESVWQGRAHDFVGFDEVTSLELRKVMYVLTWLRTTTKDQRTRCVFTFNPPGTVDPVTQEIATGRWVIPFFAAWVDKRHKNPALPGEIRYFLTNGNGESQEVATNDPVEMVIEGHHMVMRPRSRTFIPAMVKDNPYQTQDYHDHLASQPKEIRARMLFGQFADEMDDPPQQILPTQWVDEAMERWTPDGCQDRMCAIGVDPARGGSANTALVARHGVWFSEALVVPGNQTPDGHDVVSLMVQMMRDGCVANIDGTGIGASPYDLAKRQGMNVRSVVAAERKNLRDLPGLKKVGIYNRRSWLFWLMRFILDPQFEYNAKLPRNEKLREDLLTPIYHPTDSGLLVEPKHDVEKRLGRSVDIGDALLLSLFNFFDESLSDRLRATPIHRFTDGVDYENSSRSRGGSQETGWMSN